MSTHSLPILEYTSHHSEMYNHELVKVNYDHWCKKQLKNRNKSKEPNAVNSRSCHLIWVILDHVKCWIVGGGRWNCVINCFIFLGQTMSNHIIVGDQINGFIFHESSINYSFFNNNVKVKDYFVSTGSYKDNKIFQLLGLPYW